MFTLKFDYVDVGDQEQGCIKLKAAHDIWYKRKTVNKPEEWEDYKNALPFFEVVGMVPIEAIELGKVPIHFNHIQFFDNEEVLHNVILCEGLCYVMNEEGKTVDVIR